MEEAGYPRKFRLAFDRACLTYIQRYRRMRDKTKQEPLPPEAKRRKHRPTRTVPFHSEEELLEFLGVNIKDESDAVSEILGELDAAMWDSVEWDDGE